MGPDGEITVVTQDSKPLWILVLYNPCIYTTPTEAYRAALGFTSTVDVVETQKLILSFCATCTLGLSVAVMAENKFPELYTSELHIFISLMSRSIQPPSFNRLRMMCAPSIRSD